MPRSYWSLLVVLGISGLAACSPTYPKCENDDHCKTDGHNEVCVNGMCQECGKDTDCKEGFACKNDKCVPKSECTTDGECQAGFKCKNEKCVPECVENGDCANGMTCRSGRCLPAPECNSDADCPSGKKCDASQRCSESLAGDGCTLEMVHFEFNDANLTDSARKTLERDAECLKARKKAVVVAGHCDERGTEEYNLHLGERRASSVKKYLGALGVEPKNIKPTSYGKERPIDPGHDENAWAQNRRVEFSDR